MSGQGWHILREAAALTLCREQPALFDVAVTVDLPAADPLRLAHQIRQDVWRAAQRVRGFSPVVRVETCGAGLRVSAGGRVAGRVPGNLAPRIAAVLDSEANRRRWLNHASRRLRRSGITQSQVNLHKCATGFDKEVVTGP